jgi:hypothetical protein
MIFRALLGTILPLAAACTSVEACDGYVTRHSTAAHLQPKAISADLLADALNSTSYSTGIRFASSRDGSKILLDITHFPTEAPEMGTIRALMQIGRLVDDDFEDLVLVDEATPLFLVSRAELRKVGCRFNWPNNTGEDPIMLMREMVSSLRRAGDDERLVTGSSALTNQAVAIVLNEINPLWAAPDEERPRHRLDEEGRNLALLD